ncbi:NADH:ubiquinone oxidoreductase subunit L [Klebsiella pneumoniae]|uniref:NADH:ubiquinone oxidoreductase subunit L n=1 Tax=Klebsiella pneumoniae TaxID=573 RepID=A0A2X1SK52_KLEPN|nr:NADH:ubiquinone oxidoreductase subunit L [Klebsiella pneumoniae]
MTLEIASGIIAIAGILIAAWLWLGKRTLVTSIAKQCAWPLLRYLVVPCLGLRLVIRQGVRKTIPRYCLAAETRSAEPR